MTIPSLIFLCGFMGTGKSTIGHRLAEELQRPFLDLDDRITEKAGKAIPQIFADSGEQRFRTIERKALLEIIRDYEGVVALGGGSLQNQHLLDHLKLSGLLVFLKTPISVILNRISEDKNRPLLLDQNGNPKDHATLKNELSLLYEDRLSLYEQAVITIEMDSAASVEEQVNRLLTKIENHVA